MSPSCEHISLLQLHQYHWQQCWKIVLQRASIQSHCDCKLFMDSFTRKSFRYFREIESTCWKVHTGWMRKLWVSWGEGLKFDGVTHDLCGSNYGTRKRYYQQTNTMGPNLILFKLEFLVRVSVLIQLEYINTWKARCCSKSCIVYSCTFRWSKTWQKKILLLS